MGCLILSLLLPQKSFATLDDPGTFLIEAIELQGTTQYTETILRSTLQLQAGIHYSEEDLRQAVYRLESLRFVLEAEMRLIRGTERGAYKLVIHVAQTKRYFYVLHSELAYTRDNFYEDNETPSTRTTDPATNTSVSGLTLGRRWFPGKNSELNLFLPFNPGIAYSHYNIFNRNIVGSLAIQYPGDFGKNFSSYPEESRLTRIYAGNSLGVTLSFAMLITPEQWLSFNYKLNSGDLTESRPLGLEETPHDGTNFRNHKSELVWRYDTKDHPLFPTTGKFFKAGLLLDREFRNAANNDPKVLYDHLEADNYYLYLLGERYWNIWANRTLAVGFIARVGQNNLNVVRPEPGFILAKDYSTSKLAVKGLYARNIPDFQFLGKPRDFRLEMELSYEENRSELNEIFYPPPDFHRFQARLGIMGRDHFGLVRISLVYRSTNEELWQ